MNSEVVSFLKYEAIKKSAPLLGLALVLGVCGFLMASNQFIWMFCNFGCWYFIGRANGYVAGAEHSGKIVDTMAKEHDEKG